jgi:hypothetical protein
LTFLRCSSGRRAYRQETEIEEEGITKEKSKGLKESKKAPQLSLKEKRKLKKEKKNREYGVRP